MRWWFALVALAAGCWSEDLVDDTFTREEWQALSTGFVLPEPDRCPGELDASQCVTGAELGHRLFFDARLSGPLQQVDPTFPGAIVGQPGVISCASCHDSRIPRNAMGERLTGPDGSPVPRRFFVDTRSQPGNVSSGSKHTRHNALSVVNLGYKSAVARETCGPDAHPLCAQVYSWSGAYPTPAGVLTLANGSAAMNTDGTIASQLICSEPRYRDLYLMTFGSLPAGDGTIENPGCAIPIAGADEGPAVLNNLAIAFEAYLRPIESVGSRFDRYVSGELVGDRTSERDALTDVERRGLRVFVREGGCIECHGGPLLSDLGFRNTGVKQEGPNVPLDDIGLMKESGLAEDNGKFLTPSLRHVAETGPYMHAGQYNSLAEVIEFYRRGGDDPASFSGIKDHRIQPLDVTDEQARELEAFLRSLTGTEVDAMFAEQLP
jgi:cytochrome c peroxidase